MVTTRPPKTIVKPTALGPVANTDTKLLIYGLFQKGRVLAQDGCLRCLLLVMCTHPFAKEALTLHLARSEGHERYFGCNLMYRNVLASHHQHLMMEAPTVCEPQLTCHELVPEFCGKSPSVLHLTIPRSGRPRPSRDARCGNIR